jgi:hypothetical protein
VLLREVQQPPRGHGIGAQRVGSAAHHAREVLGHGNRVGKTVTLRIRAEGTVGHTPWVKLLVLNEEEFAAHLDWLPVEAANGVERRSRGRNRYADQAHGLCDIKGSRVRHCVRTGSGQTPARALPRPVQQRTPPQTVQTSNRCTNE